MQRCCPGCRLTRVRSRAFPPMSTRKCVRIKEPNISRDRIVFGLFFASGFFLLPEQPRKVPVRPRSFAQPLLAAIDEGDKIRTIYDGSLGHANSHIQQNTVEKTTAPTVMDCIQAIHWLNTAKEGSTPTVAQGTDTGWTYPQKTTTWAILKAATDESRSPRRGGDFK